MRPKAKLQLAARQSIHTHLVVLAHAVVHALVDSELTLLCEALLALGARVGLLASVDAHVDLEVTATQEALVTVLALWTGGAR